LNTVAEVVGVHARTSSSTAIVEYCWIN
jgi:hypothetical protein